MLSPFLALLLAAPSLAAPELQSFPVDGLKKIIVENESGTTSVNATAKSQAVVVVEKKKFSDACKLEIARNGDTLTVRVSRQSIKPTASCEVNMSLRIPAGIDASLASGSGDVKVEGPIRDLSFQVGSGNFTGTGPIDKFVGETGSGNLKLEKLSGGGELRAGSGSMKISYSAPMQPGKLILKAGSGDAKIAFPKGARLKVNFTAGSGKMHNAFAASPHADFEVTMEAGSGSLDVVKN